MEVRNQAFILADNQDITRRGISALLAEAYPGAMQKRVYGKNDLILSLQECGDCTVILDYTLFDFESINNFLNVNARFDDCRWVLFSAELSEDLIRRAGVESNISIILKDSAEYEILEAIRSSVVREHYICRRIADHLLTAESIGGEQMVLTITEQDILRLVAKGLSVKEIADQRHSSIHTIATHKKNIFRKIQVNSVYEATRYALRSGLVTPTEYYI